MPLAGPISEGEKFFCPKCGALYSVTRTQAAKKRSISQSASCACRLWMRRTQQVFPSTSLFIGLKMLKIKRLKWPSVPGLGQYLPKSDVCVTSVRPPITDLCRTWRQVS
jgi:hypothetical protein